VDKAMAKCYILYQVGRLGGRGLQLVIDSSSLIVLARLQGLSALHAVYGVTGLTTSVYEEVVVRGKEKGIPDAQAVETAITDGWLRPLALTAAEQRVARTLQQHMRSLSRADCETLACAQGRALTVLLEDRRARNAARARGIPYLTIQVFPLYGLIQGRLSAAQCEEWLVRIGHAMQTDVAIMDALRAAAREIGRARAQE
jgi:predicted nucleic acid-binding protein